MALIFERKSFMEWVFKIVIAIGVPDEEDIYAEIGLIGVSTNFVHQERNYFVMFRTAYQDGRECEQLFILDDQNNCVVVIQIFKNSDVNIINCQAAHVFIEKNYRSKPIFDPRLKLGK